MAKKRTEKKTKTFSEAIGLQYIFNNTITDFFIGLALVVIAVVIIIAMISFLNTGANDQSLLENLKPGEWTNTEKQFQNYCGSWGAIVSYWLIVINFGFPAFLLPFFVIMVGLQMMHAYKLNLWKWFFCMIVIILWMSVTFAKFIAPIMPSLIFNPGGKHGLFVVQNLENIMGPPGLTAILFFVAVAFLTYLTTETITVIRKALNPIGYISNKVKFEITNHGKNRKDTEAIDEVYANAAYGPGTEDEKEEYKEEEPAKVIDLNLDPDQTFANPDTPSTSVESEADGQEATGTEGDTDKDETIAIANGTQNENMSLIARQRELRTKRAEQEVLHFQISLLYFLPVGILLTQLFQFQTSGIISKFRLTHPLRSPRSEAVQIAFVAQISFHASHLHGLYLHLHGQIAQISFIIHPQLIQLKLFHPFLIQLLVVLGFRTLQIKLQQRSPCLHAVSAPAVHFHNTCADRRGNDLLNCRNYFSGSTDTHFQRPAVHDTEKQILLIHAALHQ